jgi:hypothetical protein
LDPDDFEQWTKVGPVGKLHNLAVWVYRSNKATTLMRKLQEDNADNGYPGTLDAEPGWFDGSKVATWSTLDGSELIP